MESIAIAKNDMKIDLVKMENNRKQHPENMVLLC